MEIKIKYFEGAKKLKKIVKGDLIDLYANEDIFIPLNEAKLIRLGVAMELPKGYEAHLYARSSTFKKWGCILVNCVGLIDNSYCGDNDEWMANFYCLEPREVKKEGTTEVGTWIHKGDKICQFRIMEIQPEIEFTEVERLEGKDRGGFGSTGSK